MPLLKLAVHPDARDYAQKIMIERHSTRAIVMRGESILLLYTQRYQDYSLPGGGLDDGEDVIAGLKRELSEETGAQNIRDIQAFGIYEEYRPWHRDGAEVMHMFSYCYRCQIDDALGETAFESHEINNGMKPVWVNIHEAIAHNQATMANSPSKGMSIERETFLLQHIAQIR
ncbi:MAG: NUDIX hydrolase [Vibrio sp.]